MRHSNRSVKCFSEAGVKKMESEFDVTKRYAVLREVETALIKDVIGAAPLLNSASPYLISSKIGGWTPIAGFAQMRRLETITPKS